jgi:hypothetical protein
MKNKKYSANIQEICIFRIKSRIKRENLKKVNSDEDRLFVVSFYDTNATIWGYLKPICTIFINIFSGQSGDHQVKFSRRNFGLKRLDAPWLLNLC